MLVMVGSNALHIEGEQKAPCSLECAHNIIQVRFLNQVENCTLWMNWFYIIPILT